MNQRSLDLRTRFSCFRLGDVSKSDTGFPIGVENYEAGAAEPAYAVPHALHWSDRRFHQDISLSVYGYETHRILLQTHDTCPILKVEANSIYLSIFQNIVVGNYVTRFLHLAETRLDPFLRVKEIFKIRPIINNDARHVAKICIINFRT